MKPKAFFVITRYNEDVSWINDFDIDYIIFNKGEELPANFKSVKVPNIGGNQYDICSFIYNNYDNIPDVMCFLQGNPFEHCSKEKMLKIMYNENLTTIESYNEPSHFNIHNKLDENGEYYEENNSWYISHCNATWMQKGFKHICPFNSFDEYMATLFDNYTHMSTVKFPPGSQFIVNKERCLFYTKNFWKKLMDIFPTEEGINGGTEAHIIERSLFTIFKNIYTQKQ